MDLYRILGTITVFLVHSTAAQQSTTVTIWAWGPELTEFRPSVVTANPTATTYLFTCPSDDRDNCHVEAGETDTLTIIQGPSTAVQIVDRFSDGAAEIKHTSFCSITSSTTASCGFNGPIAQPEKGGSSRASYTTIIVSEGLDKLTAQPTQTTSGVTTTGATATTGTTETSATTQTTGAIQGSWASGFSFQSVLVDLTSPQASTTGTIQTGVPAPGTASGTGSPYVGGIIAGILAVVFTIWMQ